MKRYGIWLMAALLSALLCGCAQPKTAKASPTATPALLIHISPAGQTGEADAAADRQADSGLYVNEQLGFSLRFPQDWEPDQYVIEDIDGGISVYESRNHETTYGGLLFSVLVMNQDQVDEQAYADFTILAKKDDKVLLGIRPTDVQFDYQNEELTKSYAALSVEVEDILKTAAFQ